MENNQKEIILLEDLGMLYPTETSKQKARFGLFKCFCGKEFKTEKRNITNGHTKSCGCNKNKKHGFNKHRLYVTWRHMIDRCYNPNHSTYKYYGEVGIAVCDRWLNIKNFIDDMYPSYQEGLSIDRIDNNLGYNKDNCRWVNQELQTRNTRKIRSTNLSGYRGVHLHLQNKTYIAQIGVSKQKVYLGSFSTALEAAKAYDQYIIDNNLEHTRNF